MLILYHKVDQHQPRGQGVVQSLRILGSWVRHRKQRGNGAEGAALVPKPRINLLLYHGVLGPSARLRSYAVAAARARYLSEAAGVVSRPQRRPSWITGRHAWFRATA